MNKALEQSDAGGAAPAYAGQTEQGDAPVRASHAAACDATAGLSASYSLSGPSTSLDRRTAAVRGDLADIALAGKVFVPHYAVPKPYRALADQAVHEEASQDAAVVAMLNQGDGFAVLDISGGWAWGYCMADHLVGHAPMSALQEVRDDGQ